MVGPNIHPSRQIEQVAWRKVGSRHFIFMARNCFSENHFAEKATWNWAIQLH